MTTHTVFYIFAAGLALAAVAHAESANEASYAEATSFVEVFMTEHSTAEKGDSACKKVASDSIKEIQQECDAQQKIIEKARNGSKHCCKSGQTGICSAKKAFKGFQGKVEKCGKSVKKIKAQHVKFKSVPFEQLKEGKCAGGSFFGSAFQKIKEQVKAQEKKCELVKGEMKAGKRAQTQAIADASEARKTCNSRAKDALSTAFNNAKKTCHSKKNARAYTRAKHMLCVLAGKELKDCKVDNTPTVTKGIMQQQSCPRLFCSKKCQRACAKGVEVVSFAQEAVDFGSFAKRLRLRERERRHKMNVKKIVNARRNARRNAIRNARNAKRNARAKERGAKNHRAKERGAKRNAKASKQKKKDQIECGCTAKAARVSKQDNGCTDKSCHEDYNCDKGGRAKFGRNKKGLYCSRNEDPEKSGRCCKIKVCTKWEKGGYEKAKKNGGNISGIRKGGEC